VHRELTSTVSAPFRYEESPLKSGRYNIEGSFPSKTWYSALDPWRIIVLSWEEGFFLRK